MKATIISFNISLTWRNGVLTPSTRTRFLCPASAFLEVDSILVADRAWPPGLDRARADNIFNEEEEEGGKWEKKRHLAKISSGHFDLKG